VPFLAASFSVRGAGRGSIFRLSGALLGRGIAHDVELGGARSLRTDDGCGKGATHDQPIHLWYAANFGKFHET